MKQIVQNLRNGETALEEVPCPQVKTGMALIATCKTLISVGTERMLVDFGKSGWIAKARSQPDKVAMVLDKVKTDGLFATIDAVRSKLDQPLPLGYCNVGRVLESKIDGVAIGDRVVSNGHHAEVVRVAKNLCVKVPDGVDDESAAFTVLASIALQGIRLANPSIGESIVVMGLGLVGLLTVQILKANGCRVLGMDFDQAKCALAEQYGAVVLNLAETTDPVVAANNFSRGNGVDAVVITASTKSNDPVHNAALMSRKRGRIILVGLVGLELSRADFYEKELSFQVSCSYGPGRYDADYEENGRDYPLPFVRWTEQRNFEAVLDLMESGAIDVKSLISHRFEFNDAVEAYGHLQNNAVLGIVLNYSTQGDSILINNSIDLSKNLKRAPLGSSPVVCGFFGAGNYASRTLMPAFVREHATMDTVVCSSGLSGVHHGKKNGFRSVSTDLNAVLGNSSINAVIIATRHDLHADQIIKSLQAGKNIFVEKPLALTLEEVDAVRKQYVECGGDVKLMIGYNRRFSPHVVKMKKLLDQVHVPKSFIITVNAGSIPADHWTQGLQSGGGRIIGEGCHFIDLMRFLAGFPIVRHQEMKMRDIGGDVLEDKVVVSLAFEDGSFGTIHYLANGGKQFPKERIEVFAADGVLQLDNFRTLRGFSWSGFKKMSLSRQDKGQFNCVKEFIASVKDGAPSPIPADEIFEVARVSIEVAQSLRSM